jgi:hypothetical protein
VLVLELVSVPGAAAQAPVLAGPESRSARAEVVPSVPALPSRLVLIPALVPALFAQWERPHQFHRHLTMMASRQLRPQLIPRGRTFVGSVVLGAVVQVQIDRSFRSIGARLNLSVSGAVRECREVESAKLPERFFVISRRWQ